MRHVRHEPALLAAAVAALVNVAVAFGVALTVDQQTALSTALIAVAALFVRARVTPTAKKS